VKINPAIRAGLRHHIHLEIKILERLGIANVEQVASIAMRHQGAVFDLPGVGVFFGGFPSVEGGAIKKRSKSGFHLRRTAGGRKWKIQDNCGENEGQVDFHVAESKGADFGRKSKISRRAAPKV